MPTARSQLIEAHAPGLRAKILGRSVFSPIDLERENPNLVGGDQICGSHHHLAEFPVQAGARLCALEHAHPEPASCRRGHLARRRNGCRARGSCSLNNSAGGEGRWRPREWQRLHDDQSRRPATVPTNEANNKWGTNMTINRRQMLGYSASALGLAAFGMPKTASAQANELAIAYNVNLPSWDPTTGPSAVNPTIQGFYQSVFDQFILQKPDLSLGARPAHRMGLERRPEDRCTMTVREGVTWHDGSPFTAEDVVWSLQRAGDEKTGNPIQFVWKNVNNFKIDGNKITGDVRAASTRRYFKWMSFLTGYVLPKAYYEKVGAEGFEKAPIGTGPYMVEKFEQNAFVRLKANPNYWGGKPAFDNVDDQVRHRCGEPRRRDRVRLLAGDAGNPLRGIRPPDRQGRARRLRDTVLRHRHDLLQRHRRDARTRTCARRPCMSVDKQLLVDRLLRGYGLPIDTLETPEYEAFDASIKVEYNPEKAVEAAQGLRATRTDNPVKFTIQTTKGFKPKDYEMIQAIVGMWRKVGIEANIEVYEIAKHYELRAADQLAPAAFYNWGNSIGDPTTSTGFAMYGPSPHSVWDGQDVIDAINPLWGEPDEAKRIAGWKAVDKLIAEHAYVLPLIQYAQPIVLLRRASRWCRTSRARCCRR